MKNGCLCKTIARVIYEHSIDEECLVNSYLKNNEEIELKNLSANKDPYYRQNIAFRRIQLCNDLCKPGLEGVSCN